VAINASRSFHDPRKRISRIIFSALCTARACCATSFLRLSFRGSYWQIDFSFRQPSHGEDPEHCTDGND
jgi:hypothetical protein